jgi:LysM repeat protein
MPEITLSLPAIFGLLALFITIGAILSFFALRRSPEMAGIAVPTAIPPTHTATTTATPTLTPTSAPPTSTFTPMPTPTPIEYTIAEGDTCIGIALFFKVSIQSIVTLNNLPAACNNLMAGRKLLIPQPTPTATGLPTATLSAAEQTRESCEKVSYTVQENDTLGKISASYNVPMEAIRAYNGLPGNNVMLGQTIIIPLCERYATPGPTPTPTLPPPYPAPNLLLPPNGAPFTLADDSITLQWASVGTLRENEAYMVKVVDLTDSKAQLPEAYVTDTKYVVPTSFRPKDNMAHVFSWSVATVRRTTTDENGNPVWEVAGAVSTPRMFSWTGVGVAGPTPTP